MSLYLSAAFFITMFLFVVGSSLTYAAFRNPVRQRLKRHLYDASPIRPRHVAIDITRKRLLSNVPLLHHMLSAMSVMRALGRLAEQANSPYRLSSILMLSLALFLIGLCLAPQPVLRFGCGLGLGVMPFVGLYGQKRRRLQRFERQLPEALDLVARALKAGHSFSIGMKMVGDELPDPIGTEFARIVDEIHFGGGVHQAMEGFAERIDCADLRFFITAVMVQRETGGNLAEIMERVSHLIRQRFELIGRIRALSGEGRLSAIVLIALPFAICLATYFVNRDYLMILLTDPIGKWFSMLAGILMVVGSLVIMYMIRVKGGGR